MSSTGGKNAAATPAGGRRVAAASDRVQLPASRLTRVTDGDSAIDLLGGASDRPLLPRSGVTNLWRLGQHSPCLQSLNVGLRERAILGRGQKPT